ncbi:MAG TPA: DMT family transporter [Thermoanaerobaculia bacterium]|nr:DMT family transporter [Thermoanaerobaculia bacterium]
MTFSALAVTLVVGSALAWSGFDYARKALVARIDPTPLMFLLTAAQTPLFAAWALADGAAWPEPRYWLPALASVALNVVANLAFIHAFRISPISLTVPLLSLTPAVTALAAVPLLGELPNRRHVAGIALVVVGAFMLHLRPGAGVSVRAMLRALARERGAHLMLLVVVCWSLTPPLDKLAVEESSWPVHGTVLCGGVALAVLALLAAQGRVRAVGQVRRAPGLLGGAVLVSCLALALQLLAYGLVWVALVETVKRGFGNLLALAYGRFLFDEAVGRVQVVAVLLMGAGVALILF